MEKHAIDMDEKDNIIADKDKEIIRQQKLSEDQKEKICAFAEKKIAPIYIFRRLVVPILLILSTLFSAIFVLLRFIYKEESWNLAVLFFEWIKTTWFGEMVGDYVYAIDLALLGAIGWLLKKYMINPFDKTKNDEFKTRLIQWYIRKNNLD